jgi:hypothetical protein
MEFTTLDQGHPVKDMLLWGIVTSTIDPSISIHSPFSHSDSLSRSTWVPIEQVYNYNMKSPMACMVAG